MSKGGGGGGTSGAVEYPAYMETFHGRILDGGGADVITSSVTDIINAALGNSPWTGQTAYDPDADLTNLISGPDGLQTLVTLLSSGTTLDTLIAEVLDHDRVDDSVTEYAADLAARLTSEILPRFEAGMNNINMVVSSAFVIGRALIEEQQEREVGKYSAVLHNKAFSDDAINVIQLKLEYQKAASQLIAEAYRLKIVAKKEQNDADIRLDEQDALWDLELFQYGSNVLASIAGAAASTGVKQPSTAQSVIGGAMSGVAAGAMIGGPGGALMGGLLGAASGFLF